MNRANSLVNVSSAIFQDVFLQPGCRDLWLPVGQSSRLMALGGLFLRGGQAIPSILRDELHHAQTPRNMNGVAGLLYLRAQLPPLNLAGCLAERAEGTARCSGSRGRAPCFRISHAVHHTPQYHRQMTALQTCTFRTQSGINHSANEELLFYIFTGRSELSLVSR